MPGVTPTNPIVSPNDNVPDATVTVVDSLDSGDIYALFNETEQDVGALFPDCMVTGRYEGDPHRYMLGITSPNGYGGNAAAFVQLTAKTLLWVVDWTVSSTLGLAGIPDPDQSSPDWVLLADWIEPAPVSAMPDGTTAIYRISGTFVYGKKNPSEFTYQDVTIPKMPWIAPGSFSRTISKKNLDSSILKDDGGGSSSQDGVSVVQPGAPAANSDQPTNIKANGPPS